MKEKVTQVLLPGGEWLPSLLAAFKVAGLELRTSNPRCYRYTFTEKDMPIVFDVVRSREVPSILAEPESFAVAGLSGTDVFAENRVEANWILPLLKLVPSAPQALLYLGLTPNYQGDEEALDLKDSVIYTTYPNITRQYLRESPSVSVVERGGKIEGLWRFSPRNRAIVDISSTGATAQANDIRVVRDIMRPEVGLQISSTAAPTDLLRLNDLQEKFCLAAQNTNQKNY